MALLLEKQTNPAVGSEERQFEGSYTNLFDTRASQHISSHLAQLRCSYLTL